MPTLNAKEEHVGTRPDVMDKYGRCDENARSNTSESSVAASLGSQAPQAAEQPPKGSAQRGSASARRALFARRRLNASTSPPSDCASPPGTPPLNPQGAPLSPPGGQSTGSHQRSASSPSPSPSTSAMTPSLSPTRVQPCGPQPSAAEIHPEDPLATQRPVSLLSFWILIRCVHPAIVLLFESFVLAHLFCPDL